MRKIISSKDIKLSVPYRLEEGVEQDFVRIGMDISDWIDLRAGEDVEMKQGEYRRISLGFAMEIPEGYEAHILPRSSTFEKFGIIMTNSMGIIDNKYCGNNDIWCFAALAMRDTIIHKGDRICQFRFMKRMPDRFRFKQVDQLNGPNRGGFGSTGY